MRVLLHVHACVIAYLCRADSSLDSSLDGRAASLALSDRAQEFQRRGQMHEAEFLYQKAFTVYPRNAIVCNNLGALVRARGSVEEAASWYHHAVEIEPKQAIFHANSALAAIELRKWDNALASLRSAWDLGNEAMRSTLASTLHDMKNLGLKDAFIASLKTRMDDEHLAMAHALGLVSTTPEIPQRLDIESAKEVVVHGSSIQVGTSIQVSLDTIAELMLKKNMKLDAIAGTFFDSAPKQSGEEFIQVGQSSIDDSVGLFVETPASHAEYSQVSAATNLLQQYVEELGWL